MSQIEPHAPSLGSQAPNAMVPIWLQGNNQRTIGKIPRTKRPGGLRHGLDLSVRQRIGMRLTQITPPTNHRSPSVKHDSTDRHLTLRCGFTSQLDCKSHVVTPLHIRHYTVPFT